MKKMFSVIVLVISMHLAIQAQQATQLNGSVKDKSGRPLRGASVHLMNTAITVASDSAGNFSLAVPAEGNIQLLITATGYAAVTKQVSAKNASSELGITMQETISQLDEVVVTAEKREELLQRLPISVTALSAKQVAEYRVWNVKDLTAIVPNFFSTDPGDKRNISSIRGITTTSYDPAVATYIDGVNQFTLDSYIGQLLDVERIEVLRGPQGTLYGRNAMAGVINIITRKPSNKKSAFAEISVGNYGLQRYSGGFKTPLIKDKLFFGAALLFEKMDGYYTNDFDGTKYDRQQGLSGNYSLDYLPAKNWILSLNVKHQNNRNHGAFPLVMGVEDAFANKFHLNQNAKTKLMDNTGNISFSARYSGSNIYFSSQTAYQSNYRYYTDPIDADFSPIDGISIINNYGKDWNNAKVLTQEFRVSSAAASTSKLKWSSGAYFFLQDNPVKQTTRFGENGDLVGAAPNSSLISTSTGKGLGMAVYGQAVYQLTEKLSITAGLRYDLEQKRLEVLGEYQEDPNPDPIFAFQPDTSARVNFHAFSPKVNIAYQVNENLMVFGGYSKGFRSGGLTPLSSDPSQPPLFGYEPEYSHNFEVGVKASTADKRWELNLTAFYATVNDVQVPTLVLPEAVTITRNTGKLDSKGLEAELLAAPIKGLEISWSAGLTDATYKSLNVSSGGGEVNLEGKKQIFTPEMSSMLAVQYTHLLSKSLDLRMVSRIEWKYLGKQYFDLANTIEQSDYQLLNLRVGVETKRYSLIGWARNLTNTRYIGYAYDFGAVNIGAPQTIGLTMGVKL